MITKKSTVIKRHKNPLGIFLRIIIFPFIAYNVWQHNIILVSLGIAAEVLNWTIIPPVEKTFFFIQHFIDIELNWLKSPRSPKKTVSFLLLFLFVVFLFLGLWLHIWELIPGSFIALICFNFLMNHIAKINK